VAGRLLDYAFRIWVCELPLAAANYFVLMRRVYEPRVGGLRAHRIGMTTRIVWIVPLAYALVRWAGIHGAGRLLLAGAFWTALWLAFEWGGSLLVRRPVAEILEGWHVERGYLWPCVLAAYLLAPLVVGLAAGNG
jgi:hypothetical protein